MYYVNWRLLLEFGFIFWILMCACTYLGSERNKGNDLDGDPIIYETPIVQEIVEKRVQEQLNKLQPKNNLKFHVNFIIFNILTFLLSLLYCKIIEFCVHQALKRKLNFNRVVNKVFRKIFFQQHVNPLKKSSFGKMPVLLNKTNCNSDSNLEQMVPKQPKNVKSCEMIFKNRRFGSNDNNLQLNCEKLREKIVKLQTTFSRKLENVVKERQELSKRLDVMHKEHLAAKEQLKELMDEKTVLLQRLENVTKELKLSTTTKKVALARLEEVTENVDVLHGQLEQMRRDKDVIENKFHVLETEYLNLRNGKTETNHFDRFLTPEHDDSEEFEERHHNLRAIGTTLPQTEIDMKKIKEKIINLEKCLDSFNTVNVKFENVESNLSSTFFDNNSDCFLFQEDCYSQMTESPRSGGNTDINWPNYETASVDIPRRIVSNSQAFQEFLKKLQTSNHHTI